ncbi:MAG: hypothetical protein WCT52_03330 [Candidatus Micrarchaeia archaeon]
MAKLHPIGQNLIEAKSTSPNKRVDALAALAAMQFTLKLKPATDKQITNALTGALNDKFPKVRVQAILGLAENYCGNENILGTIAIALKKDAANIGPCDMTEIQGHICTGEAGVNVIGHILTDTSFPAQARSIAATTLGKAEGSDIPIAKKYLESGANDTETSISVFSKLSLSKLNALTAESVTE